MYPIHPDTPSPRSTRQQSRYCRLLLLFFIFLLAEAGQLSSQSVGLVLSGGGAKGISHIGVIKALEDHGIPISYISGTSMGAIIGGLYASGYKPEEMIAILNSPEFPDWISGNIDERYVFYFKQKSPDASWFSFSFDFDSLVLPSLIPANIVSPLQMDFVFMELFSAAAARANYQFDSLFVPFRCVAADIAVNQPLVHRQGDLGSAIRSSMTFPFYFKPIRIDGKLLFDGGMYNNFPVDVMMTDFKPDVIIGSKAVSNYPPPQENNILSQLQAMLMNKTDYSLPPNNGVLITMNLPQIGLIDFSKSGAFIDSGYVTACRAMPEIKKHVHDSVPKHLLDARRESFRAKFPPLTIDSIVIHNLNPKQVHYMKKTLVHKQQRFSLGYLKPQYFRVIADDKIESMYPVLKFDTTSGTYFLHLNVEKEKNINIQLGGLISSRPVNQAYFGVHYKYLGKQAITLSANTYIGRFYSSGFFGGRMDFPSRLPYFLEAEVAFSQWDYFKTSTYFFEDKNPSYLIKNENHAEISIGIPVGNKGKLLFSHATAHIRNDYYQTNYFTREDTADRSFFDHGTPAIVFEVNTLNRKEFASKGLKMNMEFRYVSGIERYEAGSTSLLNKDILYRHHHQWYQYRMTYENYFKQIKPFTLGFYAEMSLAGMPAFNNYTATMLMTPAFEKIPESRTLFMPNYRAASYGAMGLINIISLVKNVDLRLEAYVFQPYRPFIELNNQKSKLGDVFSTRYWLGSASLIWNGPVAPVSLSFNYFEGNEEPLYLSFNIGFIIFNKKAIK